MSQTTQPNAVDNQEIVHSAGPLVIMTCFSNVRSARNRVLVTLVFSPLPTDSDMASVVTVFELETKPRPFPESIQVHHLHVVFLLKLAVFRPSVC